MLYNFIVFSTYIQNTHPSLEYVERRIETGHYKKTTRKQQENYKESTRKLQGNYKDCLCSFLVDYNENTRNLQMPLAVSSTDFDDPSRWLYSPFTQNVPPSKWLHSPFIQNVPTDLVDPSRWLHSPFTQHVPPSRWLHSPFIQNVPISRFSQDGCTRRSFKMYRPISMIPQDGCTRRSFKMSLKMVALAVDRSR